MTRRRLVGVLACHQRRALTLACLDALVTQQVDGLDVTAVVYDDGSTDGTAEAIQAAHPDVTVLRGDGSAFWNGGMRAAMDHAAGMDPDLYLWMNDDTILAEGAVATLVAAHDEVAAEGPAVVVGSVLDPTDGHLTYGGVVRPDPRRPMWFELVEPTDEPVECETMNGNCVLISRQVVLRVGNLEPVYVHAMGDYDYGFRARQQGCRVWVAPGTVGTCPRNPAPVHDSLSDAWRHLTGRKGLPPTEWREFTRRWAGPRWPIWFASPYVRRTAAEAGRQIRSRVRPPAGG